MKTHNRTRSFLTAAVCALALATQSLNAQPAARGAALPPALQAAVTSGNPTAIQRVISTLAGGDPAKTANLATQVVRAAEQILASNPQAAISAASAALGAVQGAMVGSSSPQQVQTVITTAMRICISPDAQRASPEGTLQIATQAIQAAATTNNSTLIASVAAQAVNVAEKNLAASPAAAVQLTSAAVQSVHTDAVMASAPQDSLVVVTAAARIVVQPEAQRVSPAVVATIATTIAQVASTPAVYAVNPAAATTVMNNATAAATAPTVAAASPGAAAAVSQSVGQAPQPSGAVPTPVVTPVTPIDPSVVSHSS